MNKYQLGWNRFFDNQFLPFKEQGFIAGRVVREVRSLFTVTTEQGSVQAEVTGHFHHTAESRSDYPTIGDWVVLRPYDDFALIESVLARKSVFSRKSAGNETSQQVVAANIDYLCIVCGLDGGRNLNPRGIERYIAMALQGGAEPVIVLNKADLCSCRDDALFLAHSVSGSIPVYMVSALTGEGVDDMLTQFDSGITIAFTGRSGVGKSSLINSFLGTEALKTSRVRKGDQTGRHTTTHKELFFLDRDVMVIDTPGMRELQLWGSMESLEETYQDIHEAAGQCRFRDCTHRNEPGCAVRQMLTDGALETARYDNFLDMRAELDFLESKVNEKKRLERKGKEKDLSKKIRRLKKNW